MLYKDDLVSLSDFIIITKKYFWVIRRIMKVLYFILFYVFIKGFRVRNITMTSNSFISSYIRNLSALSEFLLNLANFLRDVNNATANNFAETLTTKH